MSPHTIGFENDPLVPGQALFTDRLKMQIDPEHPVTPSDATRIDFYKHFLPLRDALKKLRHVVNSCGGYGEAGRRDFNPDLCGSARPLVRSGPIMIQSLSGNTITVHESTDLEDFRFHDWKFNDEAHQSGVDGVAISTRVMVLDFIEFDAVTGTGYIDQEGNPQIYAAPGWTALITDVDYNSRTLTTWETNLPEREMDGEEPIVAYLWRWELEYPAYDIGQPPLIVEGGPLVRPTGVLNVERRICRHDKITFYNTDETDNTGKRGYQGSVFFQPFGDTPRVCKTCHAVDEIGRRDRGSPHNQEHEPSGWENDSPFAIYPVAKYRCAAHIGIGSESAPGPLGHFCDGWASPEGVPLCSRFESVAAPSQSLDEVAAVAGWPAMVEGREVIAVRQELTGQVDHHLITPPSLWGLFGGPGGEEKVRHQGLGGDSLGPQVTYPILGGIWVDRYIATMNLEIGPRGALHRPWRATGAIDSACYRFLGTSRLHPKTRTALSGMALDYQCDLTNGSPVQMYSGSQFISMINGLRIKTKRYSSERAERIWALAVAGSERNLILPGPVFPWVLQDAARGAKPVSAPITEIVGNALVWRYTRADGMEAHAVGGDMDLWFETHSSGNDPESWWFQSVRMLIEPGDSVHFPNSEDYPEALRGRGFIVATATKTVDSVTWPGPVRDTGHDTVTLMDVGGGTLALSSHAAALAGKTVNVYSHRALFRPDAGTYSVTRTTGPGAPVNVTSGSQIEPCGHETSTGAIDAHVILSESEIAARGEGSHSYEVASSRVIESVNRIDACDIEEVRTLLKNADTRIVPITSWGRMKLQVHRHLIWQRGGPLDGVWGGYTVGLGLPHAPSWYRDYGPVVTDLDLAPPDYFNNGFLWHQSSKFQTKISYLDFFSCPSGGLNFRSADSVVEAWTYVKATRLTGSAPDKIKLGLVRRLRTPERLCVHHVLTGGTCAVPMPYGEGSGGLWRKWFAPQAFMQNPPVSGTVPYPSTTDTSNNGGSFWCTNCRHAPAFKGPSLAGNYGPLPEHFTESFCMDQAACPYMASKTEHEFEVWTPRNIVEPSQFNHDNPDVWSEDRLVCNGPYAGFPGGSPDYFLGTVYSPPIGSGEAVNADGFYHKIDVTDLVKRQCENRHEWGIVAGFQQAIDLGFLGSTGEWTGIFEEQINDDPVEKEPHYDWIDEALADERSIDENGNRASHVTAECSVDVAPVIFIQFAEEFTARPVPMDNLPGGS